MQAPSREKVRKAQLTGWGPCSNPGIGTLEADWTVNVRVADWVFDMTVAVVGRGDAEAVEARPDGSVESYWWRQVGAVEALCGCK